MCRVQIQEERLEFDYEYNDGAQKFFMGLMDKDPKSCFQDMVNNHSHTEIESHMSVSPCCVLPYIPLHYLLFDPESLGRKKEKKNKLNEGNASDISGQKLMPPS